MIITTALDKGYLNLTDDEAGTLLESLFDNENAHQRLEQGIMLMSTFVPEEKLGLVLDLAAIVIDAYEEVEPDDEDAHTHGDGCDCGHPHTS